MEAGFILLDDFTKFNKMNKNIIARIAIIHAMALIIKLYPRKLKKNRHQGTGFKKNI